MMQNLIQTKRVYEEPQPTDGLRILVDRLWPRGLSKQKAKIDLWLKDIAPSNKLRKWFNHDPEKWKGFRIRYKKEISNNKNQFSLLKEAAKKNKVITIVYAASDEEHNNAVIIKNLLK
jgi:uncharacterized protein YeaO (DUF488 family)